MTSCTRMLAGACLFAVAAPALPQASAPSAISILRVRPADATLFSIDRPIGLGACDADEAIDDCSATITLIKGSPSASSSAWVMR